MQWPVPYSLLYVSCLQYSNTIIKKECYCEKQLGEKLLQCSTLAVTLNSGAKLLSWEVKVGIDVLQCCKVKYGKIMWTLIMVWSF